MFTSSGGDGVTCHLICDEQHAELKGADITNRLEFPTPRASS